MLIGRRDRDIAYYGQATLTEFGILDIPATDGNAESAVAVALARLDDSRLDGFWIHVEADVLDSTEAIHAFAGEDSEVARYYPKEDDYLLEREKRVVHSEVLVVELDEDRLRMAADSAPTGMTTTVAMSARDACGCAATRTVRAAAGRATSKMSQSKRSGRLRW